MTPGPWRVVPSTAHVGGISIRCDIVTDALPFAPSFVAGDIMPEDARAMAELPAILAALRDCVESLEAAMEDPEADRDAMPPPALDRARLLLARLDGAA